MCAEEDREAKHIYHFCKEMTRKNKEAPQGGGKKKKHRNQAERGIMRERLKKPQCEIC